MSDWLVAILLGVIEGVTEFLPVSSTGHLLLVENLGWLPRQSELFNTVVQCGAVLAVLLVFTGRLRQLLAEWRTPATRLYVGQLAAAFILTGIGGLIIKKAGFHLPKTAAPVAWATLIGGVAILAVERWLRNKPGATTITWQLALAALLSSSDVVLMDLRNFVAANQGCLYELATLSAAPGLKRVVVLVNDRTEIAAAQAATANAPAGRFVWLAQQGDAPPATEQVLAPLFAPAAH
jgi:undecaprenyl pyrophosphate phosphatase UppP